MAGLPKGTKILTITEGAGREHPGAPLTDGQDIAIETPSGSRTSIFVPASNVHDTAKVADAITRQVEAIEAIHSLGSP